MSNPRKLLKPTCLMSAIITALSLTVAGVGIAEAAQGSWRNETIRWSDYRSISTIFYNNADFNGQTTTLNYSEFLKNHSDVQANHITPLVLRRTENDVSSIINNEITIDLQKADTTGLEYVYGTYIVGSSTDAKVKGNKFTFYDDLNDQYAFKELNGIVFQSTETQKIVNQQIEDNSVTIHGGNYQFISGYQVSNGFIQNNSVTVSDAIISNTDSSDAFWGVVARNASRFENNSFNIDKLTITSGDAVGIYMESTELTGISFIGNKMTIDNSTIGGNVSLISTKIHTYDSLDEFINTVSMNENEPLSDQF